MLALFAVALLAYAAPAHAERWAYLGQAHVDGVRDHDNIDIGRAAGRYRALQIRVANGPIDFDRVVVHYGNGQSEVLHIRRKIRAGGSTRAIPLAGDRVVGSLELWYGKARLRSGRPQVSVFGLR
jgi:hypothetical protein